MPDYRAEATRCTALTSQGRFCDDEPLPDAPFPICIKHAAQVLRYLNSCAPGATEDRIIVAARAYDHDQQQLAERRHHKPEPIGTVYYLQVGRLVKIGYTESLTKRLAGYPPDARLLATEPGTSSTEARRHHQFADALRHRKEWFAPTPALLAHIKGLARVAS